MSRRFTGERLLVATHNAGKLREFAELMAPHGVAVTGAAALGLAEPEETGASFAENARLKALAAAGASGLPALGDDSGLAVAGLGGAPGIHSARWAGPGRDFGRAMRRVHDELAGRFGGFAAAPPEAAFVAALCLAWPEGEVVEVEGRCEGRVVWPPRGGRGFGYDPMFQAQGFERTFGELEPAEKQALSHRSRAVRALLAACFGPRPQPESVGKPPAAP